MNLQTELGHTDQISAEDSFATEQGTEHIIYSPVTKVTWFPFLAFYSTEPEEVTHYFILRANILYLKHNSNKINVSQGKH